LQFWTARSNLVSFLQIKVNSTKARRRKLKGKNCNQIITLQAIANTLLVNIQDKIRNSCSSAFAICNSAFAICAGLQDA